MYALGPAGLPATVRRRGRPSYALERTIKHDFWAGTGFYVRPDGADPAMPTRVVVKINRRAAALGLPLRWTGRYLYRRERRAYARLQDVPNVPRLRDGDATDTGLIHDYVEGAPLRKGTPVPDEFFDELMAVVGELNRRGIAYVDTNKPENVLLGDDGRPYLFDFQISFDRSAWWPRWIGRWLLGQFHRGDVYHVLKHKRRFRPDQLTDDERAIVEHRHWTVRLHRRLTWPFRAVRRPLMRWMTRRGWIGPELSK